MEIKRDFHLNNHIRSMFNSLVKVISGISRRGKSYLLNFYSKIIFFHWILIPSFKEKSFKLLLLQFPFMNK